jgi:hypothetical protein
MKLAHISRISIPAVDDLAPGPIHSLCYDEAGNFYCSDEFNHRVISLDSKGRLRWVRGEKGSKSGEFRYPKGISFGFVNHFGKTSPCVAACDAWNHRVQFLGVDGEWLTEWTHAGSEAFREVVDIKYLCIPTIKDEAQNYWLLLDRTGHKVFALGPGAEPISHSGRALPPPLESKWAKTIVQSLEGMAGIGNATESLFDPLFYPARLLGKTEDALFVWEPLTMRLKQWVAGCLFPFGIKLDYAWECIDVTPNEFLCWIPSERCLALYDYSGALRARAGCDLRPIAADISLNQIWLQDTQSIVRMELVDHPQISVVSFFNTPLLSNVETEISLLKEDETFQRTSRIFLENTARMRSFCEQIWKLAKLGSPDAQIVASLQHGLTSATESLDAHSAQICECLHAHSLLFLKVHWLRLLASGKVSNFDFSRIVETFREIAALFLKEFLSLQQLLDDSSIYRADIASTNPDWDSGIVRGALDSVEKSLMASLRSLDSTVRSINPFLESSQLENSLDHGAAVTGRTESALNDRPAHGGRSKRMHGFLHEIDRIALRDVLEKDCPAGPYGITATSNGHVFVALRLAQCVLEMDHEYHVLRSLEESIRGELEPLCIAADSRDRLWMTEYCKNRLRICVPAPEPSQFHTVNLDCPTPLKMPYGICRWRDSQVLIADTLNNRILAVSDTGTAEIIADGKGSNPGQFRHPAAVVRSGSGDNAGIWVVDHRNHRVQKLDDSGRFILAAGKSGLGQGTIILPIAAAVFPDGSLIVAQHMITRCVALFDPEGNELDRMPLDFTPGGMLVHRNNLLITDVDSDCIRLFTRS